jgi:hypothetical protein
MGFLIFIATIAALAIAAGAIWLAVWFAAAITASIRHARLHREIRAGRHTTIAGAYRDVTGDPGPSRPARRDCQGPDYRCDRIAELLGDPPASGSSKPRRPEIGRIKA